MAPKVAAKQPMTVRAFIADYIERWEGGLSLHKEDSGNWVAGKLIGSKYGVTAGALAKHRGVKPDSITAQAMAALTLDEAVDIGKALYFDAPGFAQLPWNRVTASIVDFGWGAGPGQAIKSLQRLIGVAADSKLGPATAAAYRTWFDRHGESEAAKMWGATRDSFYELIVSLKPQNAKFLNGWKNRTAYFLPATPWWKGFEA
jgi:lysozyme family protein